VLGVARDADDVRIKDAYRKLARELHPDRNKEPGAEDRFKEVSAAYAVLSDPSQRQRYDRFGFRGLEGSGGGPSAGAAFDLGDLFEAFTGGGGGGGFFDMFRRQAEARQSRGSDVEVEITIPLAKVLTGGPETITYTTVAACKPCDGTGAKFGTKLHTCPTCKGQGRMQAPVRHGRSVLGYQVVECDDCGGRGQVIDEKCPSCWGAGREKKEVSFELELPPGLDDGMRMRATGRGMAGLGPDARSGDLYVQINVEADARFERRGPDLHCIEQVSVYDAVLGGHLKVPTLEGSHDVDIPKGTQPGTVLRLVGRGLPELERKRRGDLYVQLDVTIPKKPSKKSRALWEQLRELDGKD